MICCVCRAEEFKLVWDRMGGRSGSFCAGLFIYYPYNYLHSTLPQKLITRNYLYDSKSEPPVSATYRQP